MRLPYALRRFVPLRWQRTSKEEPLSMVLLLRKPHLFSTEELRRAAERAWHVSFAGKEESSMHCVVQSGTTTMMKAGPHLLNFFYYPAPFVENHKENTAWLRQASQREAWIKHTACLGVDYFNHDVSVELGYCVLVHNSLQKCSTEIAPESTFQENGAWLRTTKPFFSELKVDDEAEYWDTNDRATLQYHLDTIQKMIETELKKNPLARARVKAPDGKIIDLMN